MHKQKHFKNKIEAKATEMQTYKLSSCDLGFEAMYYSDRLPTYVSTYVPTYLPEHCTASQY
jgi:hypothetical protein